MEIVRVGRHHERDLSYISGSKSKKTEKKGEILSIIILGTKSYMSHRARIQRE